MSGIDVEEAGSRSHWAASMEEDLPKTTLLKTWSSGADEGSSGTHFSGAAFRRGPGLLPTAPALRLLIAENVRGRT